MLSIEKKIEDAKASVSLAGRLDTVSAPELEEVLSKLIPGIGELTLDLKDLDYISSAGLRVLLSVHKIMDRQGVLKVANAGETIMEIFEVTGFSEILNLV
ncbi:MAG: STAS domain-containing protein [Lachnospiraceae bacterium]|nr:STAS domain-containing protein [Lachnospiraceae bacterium]